jgi:hypothetical protein
MKAWIFLLLAASASAVDLTVSVAVNDPGKGSLSPIGLLRDPVKSNRPVLVNLGGNFLNVGVAAIGWEIPVAFGGPGRVLLITEQNSVINYADQTRLVATPGVRLRILPASPLTPWVSGGVGVAQLDRVAAGASITSLGSSSKDYRLATSIAGGVDFKLLKFLLLRGEVRNYRFTTPTGLFNGSNRFSGLTRNNTHVLVGVGLRF